MDEKFLVALREFIHSTGYRSVFNFYIKDHVTGFFLDSIEEIEFLQTDEAFHLWRTFADLYRKFNSDSLEASAFPINVLIVILLWYQVVRFSDMPLKRQVIFSFSDSCLLENAIQYAKFTFTEVEELLKKSYYVKWEIEKCEIRAGQEGIAIKVQFSRR